MKLHCPHCGVKGSAEDAYSGRKIKCPKCQEMFELKPDMALDANEDAVLSSAVSSIPPDSPAAPDETAPPEVGGADDRLLDAELPDGGDTVGEVDSDIPQEEEIVDSVEDEALPVSDDQLDWEDIASDDDLRDDEDAADEALDTEDITLVEAADQEIVADDTTETVAASPEEMIEEAAGDDLFDTEDLEQELEALAADSPESEAADENLEAAAVAALAEFNDGEDIAVVEDLSEVVSEDDIALEEEDEGEAIELEPYGIDEEECWQCGTKDASEAPFVAKDGRLYCTDCFPIIGPEDPEELADLDTQELEEPLVDDVAALAVKKFAIGDFISKAWAETKGAKGVIWAGSAIMYLVILVIIAGSAFLMPAMGGEQFGLAGPIISMLLQVSSSIFSVLFTAGLFYMGIKKVAGEPVSWKMIFRGFSCAGKIIFATILQAILVTIGFILLILPGIYLAVGYSMVLPLIVDKGLSPWEALETSRKAVHKVWWRVAGLYLLMGLIVTVSSVPLGIGLIWTWPMFIVLTGVVYWHLFRGEAETEIEIETEADPV